MRRSTAPDGVSTNVAVLHTRADQRVSLYYQKT